jgi:hypothetical protein
VERGDIEARMISTSETRFGNDLAWLVRLSGAGLRAVALLSQLPRSSAGELV